MIVVLGALIANVASIPPKFPIADFNSQFLNAYLPMARRSFNGAIWAGELGVSYSSNQKQSKIIKIFRCERRLRLRQYVQYAQRADCNVVYFIFNKWNKKNLVLESAVPSCHMIIHFWVLSGVISSNSDFSVSEVFFWRKDCFLDIICRISDSLVEF